MKRSTAFILIPVVLVAVDIAVANRNPVVFSLDPTSTVHPALAIVLPLYLLLFFFLFGGVLIGGLAVALRRLRARRNAAAKTRPDPAGIVAISRASAPKDL